MDKDGLAKGQWGEPYALARLGCNRWRGDASKSWFEVLEIAGIWGGNTISSREKRAFGCPIAWTLPYVWDFATSFPVFTGLIEDVGRLVSRSARGPGARLRIATRLSPLISGESIAVMGVCLTVDKILDGAFEADTSAETMERSTLGRLPIGHGLHLERALPVGGRLGGHIVAGHVDGIGRLLQRTAVGEATHLVWSHDSNLAPFLAEKGSVAIDGVSLTINRVDAHAFHVAIIPHTQDETLLTQMKVGSESNLEVDVLARYVVRWLEVGRRTADCGPSSDDTLLARLASSGYL